MYHEYIMVFSKELFRLDGGGKTGISGGQFVDWTRSIWRPEETGEQPAVDSEQSTVNGEQSSSEGVAGQGARPAGRSLEALQRKLAGPRPAAAGRGRRSGSPSRSPAAWQYVSEPGEGIWPMTTKVGVAHPAPFPVELPRRLILYTRTGELVLDPFIAAGTAAVAAAQTGRHYAGYDISRNTAPWHAGEWQQANKQAKKLHDHHRYRLRSLRLSDDLSRPLSGANSA